MSNEFACMIPLSKDYDKIMDGNKTFSGFEKVSGKTLLERIVEKVGSLPEVSSVDLFTNIEKPFDLNVSTCKWSIKNRPPSINHDNVSVEEIIDSFLQSVDADKFLYVSPRYQLLRRASIQACIDIVKNNRSQSAATIINNQCLSWYREKPLNFSFSTKTPLVSEIENVRIETGGCYTFTRDHFEKHKRRVSTETAFVEIFKWESLEILNPNDRNVVELLLDAGLDGPNDGFTN